MRGIQVFMDSLALHGVDSIFGNPGTTENPLLDSLIDHPEVSYYVALHEGVAIGAAGYYAQASGKTGIANVHVAPGLGNSIGMMYGALKANSPLIVTAGQQDTRLRLRDPLLSHDLVAMAAPVTKWSVEPQSADEVGPIMRRAFRIANEHPMGPVFVSMPINVMAQETEIAAESSGEMMLGHEPDADAVAKVCSMILQAQSPAIIVGDDVARTDSIALIVDLAEKTGATVYHEGIRSRMSFPNRHPNAGGRIPFEAEGIRRRLSYHDFVLLTDGPFFEELWFDEGSVMPAESKTVQIGTSAGRIAHNFSLTLGVLGSLPATLAQLQTRLVAEMDESYKSAASQRNQALLTGQEVKATQAEETLRKQWDSSPMSPARAVHEIARALPDDVIIVDESITASIEVGQAIPYADATDFYGPRGGGIGQGLAGVIGIKVAHPDRPVVCISGDGSAMYSIQAFWTAAHHNLPIVFIILSNREYRVLKHNLDIYRQRFNVPSNRPYPHMDLEPTLNFVELAKGMGVGGEIVENADDLKEAVSRALSKGEPSVIEVVISGKQ